MRDFDAIWLDTGHYFVHKIDKLTNTVRRPCVGFTHIGWRKQFFSCELAVSSGDLALHEPNRPLGEEEQFA